MKTQFGFVNLQKYNNALEGKQLCRKYTRFPVKANIRVTVFLTAQSLLGQEPIFFLHFQITKGV